MNNTAALQAAKRETAKPYPVLQTIRVAAMRDLDPAMLEKITAFHAEGVAATPGYLEPRNADYFRGVAACDECRIVVAQDQHGAILAQAALLSFEADTALENGAVTHPVAAVALQKLHDDPCKPLAVVQCFYSPAPIKGLGSLIMGRILAAAGDIGAKALCAVVKRDNDRALGFFRGKFGLEQIVQWHEKGRDKVLLYGIVSDERVPKLDLADRSVRRALG